MTTQPIKTCAFCGMTHLLHAFVCNDQEYDACHYCRDNAVPVVLPMAEQQEDRANARLGRIGQNIRTARIKRGLSIGELATRAGMSRTGLTNIELGRSNVHIESLCAIADVLCVSIDYLCGRDTDAWARRRISTLLHDIADSLPYEE